MDKGLQDQIRRAAVSVMSNIAEGFDRGTRQELINYFYIAKGSCGEVKSQLYISYDISYIDISKFRHGIGLCDACSRFIQSFVEKVKSSGKLGQALNFDESDDYVDKRLDTIYGFVIITLLTTPTQGFKSFGGFL